MQDTLDASYSSSHAGETAAQLAALRGDVAALVAQVGQLQGVAKSGAEVTVDESRAVLNQVAALRGEMASILASQKHTSEDAVPNAELNSAIAQLGNLCEWTLRYCQDAAGGQAAVASRLTELQEETGVVASAMRRLRGGLQVDVQNAFKQIINEAAEQQRTHTSPSMLEEELPQRSATLRQSPGVVQRPMEIRTPSTARRRSRPPPQEISELRRLLKEHRELELAEAAERQRSRRPTPTKNRPAASPSPAPRRESHSDLKHQMQQLIDMQKMQLQLLNSVAQLQAPQSAPKATSATSVLEEQLLEMRRTQERQSELLEELRQQSLQSASESSSRPLPDRQPQVHSPDPVQGRLSEPSMQPEPGMPAVLAPSPSEVPVAYAAMPENPSMAYWQQLQPPVSELQARPGHVGRDAHQVYQELLQLQRLRAQLNCLELPQEDPPVRPLLPRPEASDVVPEAARVEVAQGAEPPKPMAQSLQIQFHPMPDRPMQLTIDSPSHSVAYEHLDLAQSPRVPSNAKHQHLEEAPPAAVAHTPTPSSHGDSGEAPAPPPPADIARAPVPSVMRRPCPPPPPPSAPPRFGAAAAVATGETTQWSDLQLQLREQLESLRRRQQKQSDAEGLEAGKPDEEQPASELLNAESRAEFLKRQQDSLAERLRNSGLVGELTASTSSSLQMSYRPRESEDTEQKLESEPTSPDTALPQAQRLTASGIQDSEAAQGTLTDESLRELQAEDACRSRTSEGSPSFDGQEDCHHSFILSPCGHLRDLPGDANPPQPVCRPLMPAFSASTGDSSQPREEPSERQSVPFSGPGSLLARDLPEEFRPGVVKDLLARAREALAAAKSSQAVQAGSFRTPSTLRPSTPRGSPSIGWQPPSPEPEVQRPSPQPHPSPALPPSPLQPPTVLGPPIEVTAAPGPTHRFHMWCTPEDSAGADVTLTSPECLPTKASNLPVSWERSACTEPICGAVMPLQPDKE